MTRFDAIAEILLGALETQSRRKKRKSVIRNEPESIRSTAVAKRDGAK